MSFDLLINALIAGVLIGGFYAAVTVGISISFGILDVVNIAHPALPLFAAINGLAKPPPILHTSSASLWGNVGISRKRHLGMA